MITGHYAIYSIIITMSPLSIAKLLTDNDFQLCQTMCAIHPQLPLIANMCDII